MRYENVGLSCGSGGMVRRDAGVCGRDAGWTILDIWNLYCIVWFVMFGL